jgi:hypothetical protein
VEARSAVLGLLEDELVVSRRQPANAAWFADLR